MKVLIIGNGGREHAIAWKIAKSNKITDVFVAPGNAGTQLEPKVQNVAISILDIHNLINFAKTNEVDFTIVGPEAPLVEGIVDQFTEADLLCFGPKKAAAQLEGSKVYAKDFLKKYNIPTANSATFNETQSACDYLEKIDFPLVIKVDGLAAGKGVIIAKTKPEALEAIDLIFEAKKFGGAGNKIIIEEFLTGEEVSFIVVADGKQAIPLATSQDHKALRNRDKGPNTGGMGAYSPAPIVTDELHNQIMQTIIQPTLEGMHQEGIPYTGFLYAGLMITKTGPKVLEFNCRLGDPEAQPLLMRLESDLVDIILAALNQNLNNITPKWDPRTALAVVLAAKGYPDDYSKGNVITGLENTNNSTSKIFHAGTLNQNGTIITNGGRVLAATALGHTVQEAQAQAYKLAKNVNWNGVYYRTDIGYRAIKKEKS